MVWRLICDTPIPESMKTQFTHVYMFGRAAIDMFKPELRDHAQQKACMPPK